MINISVTSPRLVAGQRARLDIRFSNIGSGPCRKVVFTLGVPPGLRLVGGGERIDIAALEPGADVIRSVTVEAAQAGEYPLTSPNFSYRDEDDEPVRDRNWRAVVAVADQVPSPPPPTLIPPPEVRVECEATGLVVREWAQLPILVRNRSSLTVSDVSVEVAGPLEVSDRRGGITALPGGKSARLRFHVRPHDAGLVPVTVRVAYGYLDGSGSSRRVTREERLHVQVARDEGGDGTASGTTAAAGSRHGTRERTVLFLAANPRNLTPLRPDEELRLIEQELWLSPNRDDFRLVSHVAVQLIDISRALVRYRPQIVHFSGHGDETGRIYVEDPLGYSKPVELEGLAEIFGAYNDTIRCVIVNACHSQRLARAIARHVDHAIGMRYEIGDNAAVRFSVGFYQAMFGGATVPQAFKTAPALLRSDAETMNDYEVPQLFPGDQA